MAARTLGEYFQDQQGAVVHRQFEVALQVALLRRTQRLVEQHFRCAVLQCQLLDLVGLAATDKKRSVGRTAFARHMLNRRHAGGSGEQAELFESGVEMRQPQINSDQDGLRHRATGRFQGVAGSVSSAAVKLTARPGTMVEIACL